MMLALVVLPLTGCSYNKFVSQEETIKAATQDITLSLLTGEGLDVQVLVYDIATSLPPEQ